ncbi:MAG: sugar ABC transporter substrate-binding protein [Methylobacteriaceae bacterium]|nr:sugar ABC transporter substrate-binding protein [Methylobacteriaceae bacterium]
MKLAALTAAGALMCATAALAEDFHGFDPSNFDGNMLPSEQLKAMVADAMKVSPPKNGKTYSIAFANLQRGITFCAKVEQGIKADAEAAGVDLPIADNRLDGATALANAQSFINRNVDYVIEFQTDANFGATIMQQMNAAGIKVTAIDIPMPGATFFGVNNPRAGYMGGSYLAQAAIAKYGLDKVKAGYFLEGELPQSGPIPKMRTDGQVAGFLDSIPGFDPSHVLKFDSKNTLEESFAQTNNLLGKIPAGVPIMGTAINDQATTGILRAAKQAGREADTIVVGLGADEVDTLVNEPNFVASVGSFPENYGNYIIPMALGQLAGKAMPPAVLVHHVMVTKGNVCKYYPKSPCAQVKEIDYKFPQDAFAKYLVSLHDVPELKDVQNLIPSN